MKHVQIKVEKDINRPTKKKNSSYDLKPGALLKSREINGSDTGRHF